MKGEKKGKREKKKKREEKKLPCKAAINRQDDFTVEGNRDTRNDMTVPPPPYRCGAGTIVIAPDH